MIACLDVYYRDEDAAAACVLFNDWSDERPMAEVVVRTDRVEPYEPGHFFRRELPCLLAVLDAVGRQQQRPEVIIIDGFVWLGDERSPGLGARLYEAIDGQAAVIGAAKSRFQGAGVAREVLRGGSRSPLYVTAVGMDLSEAASRIREMAGPYRIPTLLKRVDQLSRRPLIAP